jgi:hypothetical protein
MLPALDRGMKHCPSFRGYAAGEDGAIYSCHRTNAGIGSTWKRRKTAIIKVRGAEYEQIGIRVNGRPFVTGVHRLVLDAFYGPCPDGHECRHLNGNSLDNRACNLRWGTRQQNSDDKRRHGTMQAGSRNGQAKLTEADVEAIRVSRQTTTLLALAIQYGVSRSQIKRIVYGKSWK